MAGSWPSAGCGPLRPIEVVEVVRHDRVVSSDPEDDQGGSTGELGEGREWRTRGG
jgi:hypothetical protein